jgi:hypothetical protein
MGLFGKLVESSKENGMYRMVKRKLVADGEEHAYMAPISATIAAMTVNKSMGGFEAEMAKNGFKVISVDIQEHPSPNYKMLKIVYKSV